MVTTGGVVRGVEVYTSGGGPVLVVASLGLLAELVLLASSTETSNSTERSLLFEPCYEKTCLRGLRPGKTQTGLHSHRS